MSFIINLVGTTNAMKRWKVTYSLSISECTSSSKVASGEREIQSSSYILSELETLWSSESNLPAEHKWMQVEKKKYNFHVIHHTSCKKDKHYEAVKSNLHPEHKQMHKFIKVASGERVPVIVHTSW